MKNESLLNYNSEPRNWKLPDFEGSLLDVASINQHLFQTIKVKRTLSVRIEQCDLDAYLINKGWEKTFNGWALNSGHEMMQCLGLQMMIEQLAFVENRDSFLVFEDIDAIRKDRIARAWRAAIERYGDKAFNLFCEEHGASFIDNDEVNREFAGWGGVYLREQANGKEV
jgi:hypothetical protein